MNETIESILFDGSSADKKELFSFTEKDDVDMMYKKYVYFTRYFFPTSFNSKSVELHEVLTKHYIKSYLGQQNFLIKGFRGCGKTAIMKLVMVFVLACDSRDVRRMYNKVLSKDLKNSKQVVTDVYNALVVIKPVFGDLFAKEGDKKREETMGSFTMKSDVKLTAGTVGQTQRGHNQGIESYRPDFIWFDDIEDRESIKSAVVTQSVMDKIEEAIDGMSPDGSYICTANYISEYGSVEMIASKGSVTEMVWAIATDCVYDGKKLVDAKPTWADRFPLEKVIALNVDSQYWFSEYLCDPSREDDKFFDLDLVDEQLKTVIEPIRNEAGLKVWKDFYQGHRYDVGADVAGGGGGDSSTIAAFNLTTGELVATYHNNRIAPDIFAHEIARAGNKYGGCLVAPERNSIGLSTVDALKNIYSNVYQDRTMAIHSATPKKILGWHTNSKTKPDMLYKFRTAFNEGFIKIYDVDVLREMKSFSFNDLENNGEALATRHFDLLIAVCIAWAVKDHAHSSKDPVKEWKRYKKRQAKVNSFGGL